MILMYSYKIRLILLRSAISNVIVLSELHMLTDRSDNFSSTKEFISNKLDTLDNLKRVNDQVS